MSIYAEEEDIICDYVFETKGLIDKLENIIINVESEESIENYINEIIRIMHTIKGNSMIVELNNIAQLMHSGEDLICYIRDNDVKYIDYGDLVDIVLNIIDYVRNENLNIRNKNYQPSNNKIIIQNIKDFMENIK